MGSNGQSSGRGGAGAAPANRAQGYSERDRSLAHSIRGLVNSSMTSNVGRNMSQELRSTLRQYAEGRITGEEFQNQMMVADTRLTGARRSGSISDNDYYTLQSLTANASSAARYSEQDSRNTVRDILSEQADSRIRRR